MLNYPIKFKPILKDKIWGGSKLRTILKKDTKSNHTGESWEISEVEKSVSIVSNGPLKGNSLTTILSHYKGLLVGKSNYEKFGEKFPLLIKFIDAKTELSVQLHPNDQLAKQRHNSLGKTEMWYIMQADEDAKINIGFNKYVTEADYIKHLDEGKIPEILNFETVQKGDSFFIKTGKVHAIGAGVLLAEIQQTSDITYRIYDWDREDHNGNRRELHTALAIDAIDFNHSNDFKIDYNKTINSSSEISSCKYFTTNFLPVEGELTKDYSNLDSFVIYMCVSGAADITVEGNTETIAMGQTVLIPARNNKVEISATHCELLEIYIH